MDTDEPKLEEEVEGTEPSAMFRKYEQMESMLPYLHVAQDAPPEGIF